MEEPLMHEAIKSDAIDVAKAAPPAIVALHNYLSWSIADWVQFVTLIYLLLIVAHKVWVWTKEVKTGSVDKSDD
jgi:hypothetical protein